MEERCRVGGGSTSGNGEWDSGKRKLILFSVIASTHIEMGRRMERWWKGAEKTWFILNSKKVFRKRKRKMRIVSCKTIGGINLLASLKWRSVTRWSSCLKGDDLCFPHFQKECKVIWWKLALSIGNDEHWCRDKVFFWNCKN